MGLFAQTPNTPVALAHLEFVIIFLAPILEEAQIQEVHGDAAFILHNVCIN